MKRRSREPRTWKAGRALRVPGRVAGIRGTGPDAHAAAEALEIRGSAASAASAAAALRIDFAPPAAREIRDCAQARPPVTAPSRGASAPPVVRDFAVRLVRRRGGPGFAFPIR